MDKKDWENQLALLENLLKQKKFELETPDRLKRDIEELEFTVECYKDKVKTFK